MPTQRKPTPRKAAYKASDVPSSRVETDRRIPLIILAVIAALMALVLIFTQCTKPASDDNMPAPGEPAVQSSASSSSSAASSELQAPTNPSAKATFSEYTWGELKEISEKIAKAKSDSDAIAIATQYNLVNADGKLDPSATKSVALNDGSTTEVRIIGFNHDTVSNGNGKAGITFMFTEGIGTAAMNDDGTSVGGWNNSYGTYFVGIELWSLIPDELASNIVEVSKSSNDGAEGSVSESGDVFWLPSYAELFGSSGTEFAGASATLGMEGSQYQLFADAGVSASSGNSALVVRMNDQATSWWLRSADPAHENAWFYVDASGRPADQGAPEQAYALVPGFCF